MKKKTEISCDNCLYKNLVTKGEHTYPPMETKITNSIIIKGIKKVYCKNCKYFLITDDIYPSPNCRCNIKGNKEIYVDINPITGIKHKYITQEDSILVARRHLNDNDIVYLYQVSDKLNKKNECPFYKKVWWKFWIK